MDVLAVADQLGSHSFAFAARADGAGLAVVDAGHGVVQVRQMARACVKDGGSLFIRAVGVRDGDSAELTCKLREFHRAGQLRSHVRNADEALGHVIKPFKRAEIRIFQIRAVLRALFLFGEERSLHLDAKQAGAARRLLVSEPDSGPIRRLQHVIRQRHGRGREAGHAVLGKIARHFDKAVVIAVGKIRAGIAVVMHVDEAGNDILIFQINAVLCGHSVQNFRKFSVFHTERAVLKLSIYKEIRVFEQHPHTSGRLAAAMDWPTRRKFSSGSMTRSFCASAGYSSFSTRWHSETIRSPPTPEATRPSTIRFRMS